MSEYTLVKMKDEADMRLNLVAHFGDGFRNFQASLLKKAGQELMPHGVMLAYTLAVHAETAELKGLSQPFTATLYMVAETVFDEIIDGDASQVKELWNEMMGQVVAKAPVPVATSAEVMTYETFAAVQHIAEVLQASSKATEWRIGDRRDDGVNPYYNQLKAGLVVEFYYGHPSDIYTPLGKWSVSGGGGGMSDEGEKFTQLFLNHPSLKLELLAPQRDTQMGSFGPWYSVRRVKELEFPVPENRENAEYVPYEDANAKWDNLMGRFLAIHAKKSGYTVQVKEYPDSEAAKPVKGQEVLVESVNEIDLTATVTGKDSQGESLTLAIPLIDMYLFREKHVTIPVEVPDQQA